MTFADDLVTLIAADTWTALTKPIPIMAAMNTQGIGFYTQKKQLAILVHPDTITTNKHNKLSNS